MTVLSACQQASKLMGGATSPASIYGSTDPYSVELSALANESATAILKAHDWRKLTVLKTQIGDGIETAFDLPSDYDRMLIKNMVFMTRSRIPLMSVPDLDTWLDMEINSISSGVGWWIMLGGQIHIKPVMSASESAKFYYISNEIVTALDTSTKATFTADTDVFRLSERLLTLDLVWRWRQLKGLEYAEQMRNFELAFGEEAGREKGSRIIHVGAARLPDGATFAYPGIINA